MSELPNVAPGEIIASGHINDVKNRTVQRYANAADRATFNPTPTPGDLAFLEDTFETSIYTGVSWQPYMPTTGGQFTGNVGFSAGAIDTVTSDYQAVVRNAVSGLLQRYNIVSGVIPLSGGNTGDARYDAAAQMVTISFDIAVDNFANPIAQTPVTYRPIREYRTQAVFFTSGGTGAAGTQPLRWQTNGEIRMTGIDAPPVGGTIQGVVSYPWSV